MKNYCIYNQIVKIITFFKNIRFFLSWYNIKNGPKKYVKNKLFFIVDEYQKDMCFYDEDSYYYDIDADRVLLFKKVTINILLDTNIQIKWISYNYN